MDLRLTSEILAWNRLAPCTVADFEAQTPQSVVEFGQKIDIKGFTLKL